jgi:hypothetical protein
VPKYRLDDLGWWEFERLCQALLQSSYGLVVAAWGGSGDLGRDAYSEADLDFPQRGTPGRGPFVFQAKFVQGANAAGANAGPSLTKAVNAELTRIAKHREAGRWNNPGTYALLTNAPIAPALRKTLTDEIKQKLVGATIVIAGEADLAAMLADAPAIRTSFPQLLGLQDLSELLISAAGHDAEVRGDLLMEEAADLAPVFVPTDAYNRALTILSDHGFVVLTGPPEMGKTSIALMIALARLAEGWDVFDCAGPEDLFKVHQKPRPQVFIADDAFGSTEYTPHVATRWAAELHKVLRAVDARHWLLWTSRPAPLKLGLRQLQLQSLAEKFPDPGEVQVDASRLSTQEKALILYRHCKAAGLDEDAKTMVRAHARFITENKDFTPERIRRLTRRVTEIAREDLDDMGVQKALREELEQSTDRMTKSFERLDDEHKRLLVAMLDAGSGYVSEAALQSAYGRHAPLDAETPVSELISDLAYHFLRPL